jgi:predicted DNA-binding transcriptional regulator AlpA
MNKHGKQKSDARKPKRFLRRDAVADRYGVNVRTLERMWKDGRIPPPDYFGRFPAWDEAKLDASDRQMVRGEPYSPTAARKLRESASV